MSEQRSPVAAPTRAQSRRAARAAVIGTVMEYYDLGIYATAASTVFATVFFPGTSPGLATVQAIATFSVAYLVRPVAAFLLGRAGDRVGRRAVMIGCLIVMGVATLGIGLLPGYAAIGWLAPLLLVLLRVAQGVGASAEYSGAALVAYEFAPRHRRGLYGSAAGFGAAGGGVLASLVMLAATSSLPSEQFLAWGWRVPFLASALIVGYGLYLRTTLPETPEFELTRREGRISTSPLRELVTGWPRASAAILLTGTANAGLAYFMQVFVVSYANNQMQFERGTVLVGLLLSQVVLATLTPAFGAWSDRIGLRMVMGFGLGVAFVLSFFLFVLIRPGFPLGLWIALVIGNGLSAAAVSGTIGAFGASQLPARIRFTGTATARELGTLVGSGGVPLLAAQLAYVAAGSTLPLSGLFLLVSVLGIVGLAIARPTTAVEAAGGTAPPDETVPPGTTTAPSATTTRSSEGV